MNKANCNIVKDILPLYIENVVSEDTKAFVEEHLQNCDACKKEVSLLKSSLEIPEVVISEKDDLAFLKKIGLDIRKKIVFTGILSAVITVLIVILSFAYLTAPEYQPYTDPFDLVTVNEENGSVTLSFAGAYELYERKLGVYDISLYDTIWNKIFDMTQNQVITVNPNGEKVTTIYYVSNGEQMDKVIYGENPNVNGGVITLPRLVLNYYFSVAFLMAFVLTILLLLFRKNKKIKKLIVTILLIPLSYIVSHIMIKGFNATSYSAIRDFYLILLLFIPIYFMFYVLYKKKNSY